MKQIKFRVWSKIKNTWVHNMMLLACIDGLPFAHFVEVKEDGDVKHHIYNASSLDVVIQQYTGLKDSNGKEIYEGDILHHVFDGASYPKEARDEILTCVWGANSGLYSFENHNEEYYWAEIANRCEVIGNIFETPELLEKL